MLDCDVEFIETMRRLVSGEQLPVLSPALWPQWREDAVRLQQRNRAAADAVAGMNVWKTFVRRGRGEV